jgi:hypothetical protein
MAQYLLVPVADRDLLRWVLSRCDQILGYPRTHSASEPGVRWGPCPAPVTETVWEVWYNATTGTIAVLVTGIATQLADRFVEWQSVRKKLSAWIADQGWTLTSATPANPQNWVRVAHRDGGAGSATGLPIPEGSE